MNEKVLHKLTFAVLAVSWWEKFTSFSNAHRAFQRNFRSDKKETKTWKSVYQLHFETKFWNCFFLRRRFYVFFHSGQQKIWFYVNKWKSLLGKSLQTFTLNTIHVLAGRLGECDIFFPFAAIKYKTLSMECLTAYAYWREIWINFEIFLPLLDLRFIGNQIRKFIMS